MKDQTILVGAHTSAAGGPYNALLEGKRIGATTIQLFTANQKQWKARELSQEQIDQWNETLKETGLQQIMSHDSYLINLGSPDPELLKKSRDAFQGEIGRCQQLGITYLNFHPGAALKDDPQNCLDRIAESISGCEKIVTEGNTRLLLENTAGQGSSVGWRFEHLAHIISNVHRRIPIGVCIDTCHAFAAGYDIRTTAGVDAMLKEFDKVVGLKHLYAFHLNDSLKDFGTRVDRHAPLGEGKIGLECFKTLMRDPRTRHLPKYLETPDGPVLWEKEIKMLKEFAKD